MLSEVRVQPVQFKVTKQRPAACFSFQTSYLALLCHINYLAIIGRRFQKFGEGLALYTGILSEKNLLCLFEQYVHLCTSDRLPVRLRIQFTSLIHHHTTLLMAQKQADSTGKPPPGDPSRRVLVPWMTRDISYLYV